MMEPAERDRLLRLEINHENMIMCMQAIERKFDRNAEKLDELIAKANMGQGAWWLILRIGVIIAAMSTGAAWVIDRWWFHK